MFAGRSSIRVADVVQRVELPLEHLRKSKQTCERL